MTTKSEFVEMWDNCIEKLKKIYFITKSNKQSGIIATEYKFKQFGDEIYIILIFFEEPIALIFLDDIIEVE